MTKNGNKPSYLQLGPCLQSRLLLQSTAGAALSFMCTSEQVIEEPESSERLTAGTAPRHQEVGKDILCRRANTSQVGVDAS